MQRWRASVALEGHAVDLLTSRKVKIADGDLHLRPGGGHRATSIGSDERLRAYDTTTKIELHALRLAAREPIDPEVQISETGGEERAGGNVKVDAVEITRRPAHRRLTLEGIGRIRCGSGRVPAPVLPHKTAVINLGLRALRSRACNPESEDEKRKNFHRTQRASERC